MNDEVTYKQLVDKELSSGQTFWEFDGSDDCEDCSGWDGKDNRCNCGNRRVSWVLSDCKTFVYPEVD